jgi:penicillin-insensitive murein DD-endopeptidase
MSGRLHLLLIVVLLAVTGSALAQDLGSIFGVRRPPLANPTDPNLPAKELFGRKPEPAPMVSRSIGKYSRGCLAGGMMLPVNGPTWQVMRLSRNRNWAHPEMIKTIERLAAKVPQVGWPGLLVGDMTQPRGGPMITGHVSHQIGLDADFWLTPMPNYELTRQEREEKMATNVVNDTWDDVRHDVWSPLYIALLKTVAEDPQVERVLVNGAIKQQLCREVKGDRSWLGKMRVVPGHNYHFHIRIKCPADSPDCTPDVPPPAHEDCAENLAFWKAHNYFRPTPSPPGPPGHQLLQSDLPPACREVLIAPRAGAAKPE